MTDSYKQVIVNNLNLIITGLEFSVVIFIALEKLVKTLIDFELTS